MSSPPTTVPQPGPDLKIHLDSGTGSHSESNAKSQLDNDMKSELVPTILGPDDKSCQILKSDTDRYPDLLSPTSSDVPSLSRSDVLSLPDSDLPTPPVSDTDSHTDPSHLSPNVKSRPDSDAESDLDSDDSDAVSMTSTVRYGQESFSIFQDRALLFARQKVWPDAPFENIRVERLEGGGENRITRLFLQIEEQHTQDYILRTPRWNMGRSDVASLLFVQRHSTIPVPQIMMFDDTGNNELLSPYMVQKRIPGEPLWIYPQLNHDERCQVAKELGDAFRQMLAVRSSTSGQLALSGDDFNIVPFQSRPSPLWLRDDDDPLVIKYRSPPIPYSDPPASKTVRETLTAAFQTMKDVYSEFDHPSYFRDKRMDDFIRMTSQLEAQGWLDDVGYSLAHLDLAPRNVLVDRAHDPEQPIISAVLDWDSAVLAPSFMSCAPPLWLWAWLADDDEDERTANDTPASPEDREVKRIFECAAGPDYLRFAYQPAYRLARRLVRFAIEGNNHSHYDKEAEEMLKEWNSIIGYDANSDSELGRDSKSDSDSESGSDSEPDCDSMAGCDSKTGCDSEPGSDSEPDRDAEPGRDTESGHDPEA